MYTLPTGSLIRDDGSELVSYDQPDFPVMLRKNNFRTTASLASAKSHWHDEVEFISIISGRVKYNVNGEIITMKEGEGIFVNARQFHYILSDNGADCLFYCAVLHPMLLSASARVDKLYIRSILDNADLPYLHLSNRIPWQAGILRDIGLMCERNHEAAAELIIQQLFFRLWQTLCVNAMAAADVTEGRSHHLTILKSMVAFTHENYREKLELEDICEAGGVGKTLCTSIFRKCVNCTPMNFLTEYRLKKAAELLHGTDMNVTEIAYETGFSGASYFSESFRKCFNCSPREFRAKTQEQS